MLSAPWPTKATSQGNVKSRNPSFAFPSMTRYIHHVERRQPYYDLSRIAKRISQRFSSARLRHTAAQRPTYLQRRPRAYIGTSRRRTIGPPAHQKITRRATSGEWPRARLAINQTNIMYRLSRGEREGTAEDGGKKATSARGVVSGRLLSLGWAHKGRPWAREAYCRN